MYANIKKSKRRFQIRYPISLDALLVIDKSVYCQCVILNFCAAGFYLELKQPNSVITLGKTILIRFANGLDRESEPFEIRVKVVHIQPTGVGVTIENMPMLAFNALIKAANLVAASLPQDRRGAASDKMQRENFKNSFKQLLIEQLPFLIADFFDSFGQHLAKFNGRGDYFINNSVIDDLITTLNEKRKLFVSEFCNSILFHVDNISKFQQKIDGEDFLVKKSLSLIDKDDFEDWLNLSAVIRKLNDLFEGPLNELVTELCRVFGLSREAINNPVGPEILCDAFREVILQFEFEYEINRILYNSFSQTLSTSLVPLYEKLKILLSTQNTADRLIPIQPVRHAYHDYLPAARPHASAPPSRDPPSVVLDFEELTELAASRRKTRLPPARLAANLLEILNEISITHPEALNNLLTKNKREIQTSVQRYYSANEIASAISKLRIILANENSVLHLNPSILQQRLLETLKGSDKSSKALSQTDIRRLEIYGGFFEILFNDLQLSADIRPFLVSIYPPFLSLAMQGDDFLETEGHPVRNILNLLAVLQSFMKSVDIVKGVNIKTSLEKLIGRISRESIGNPGVLTEVEQELAGIAQQANASISSKIKRITEDYRDKQKQESALRRVRLEIDKRIAGKFVPAIIPTLLETGWRRLLENQELLDENRLYWQALDDLLTWLYQQDSMLNMQSGSIQKTLNFIREQLGTICGDESRINHVLGELNAMLLGSGQPKVRKAVKMIKAPPVGARVAAQVGIELLFQVEELMVGDWLMISGGSSGGEPMKLVWISDDRQTYVLVNRDVSSKIEFNQGELLMLLQSGAANKMESLDTPLADRATHLMLRKIHEKLIYNATHDPITGLLTSDEFIKQLKIELSAPGNSQHMLCHLEILDFRLITNICGVKGGVELQRVLTRLLREQLRNEELFAKLGDKTFAILFKHCSENAGYELAKKLLKCINDTPFQWQDKSFAIEVSMGLAPFGEYSYDVNQLLRQADSASISAESQGHSHILLFTNGDENIQLQNKLHEWAGQINNVFSQNRLFARCQKIAPISPHINMHSHYEILLGVRDGAGGIIAPDNFIPAVERCKRMPEVDQWVIKNVFDWIEKNRHVFSQTSGFSINLSGQSINSESFLTFLTGSLASSKAPLDSLVFEITETVAAANLAFTKKFIRTIKQFGCKFSLDDFGSGYSSYSYLKNLNVDYLKIDGAFIKDIAKNKADLAIVKSINEISHSLGLETIAEYVENDEILEILRDLGIDFAQGHGIEKPKPLTELGKTKP